MTNCDVLFTGTGSLAEACLFALAITSAGRPLQIAIGGRDADRCRWLSLVANARAAALSVDNFTRPMLLDWSSSESLAKIVGELKPKVIVQTASMQSPWALAERNGWSTLVQNGGYGLGTPFHAILTARLVHAIELACTDTTIINGAYPDVANSVIQAAGLKSPIGFGNADIIAVAATALLGSRKPGTVRVLAQWEPHVADFRQPADKRLNVNPRAWIDGKEIDNFMQRFKEIKFPLGSDDSLNQLTGTTVVPMAIALVTDGEYIGHAAGPFGLPGGYPVRIRNGEVSLNLPEGVTLNEAVAFNKGFEEMEGLHVDMKAKKLLHVGKTLNALRSVKSSLADGYAIDSLGALEAARTELEALRSTMLKRAS